MNRKLVVFVPAGITGCGAGCAVQGRSGAHRRLRAVLVVHGGHRDLFGGEGTAPTIGERGREERVAELRLETVYPADREDEVVRALRSAHPYEEPAFDLYPLL